MNVDGEKGKGEDEDHEASRSARGQSGVEARATREPLVGGCEEAGGGERLAARAPLEGGMVGDVGKGADSKRARCETLAARPPLKG